MLKKIAGSTLVLVSLVGCGHHQHWVAPAVVGVAVGHAIATSNQPKVYTERVIVQPARVVVDYSVYNQWNYQERESCFRGVEARARQEQARRNQEAYRQGYGR